METQRFYVHIDSEGMAHYRLMIPVLNIDEGCRLQVCGTDGAQLDVFQASDGRYVATRSDGVGEVVFSIQLVGANGKLCDEKRVEVVIDDTANPSLLNRVGDLLQGIRQKNGGEVQKAITALHREYPRDVMRALTLLYFASDASEERKLECLTFLQAARHLIRPQDIGPIAAMLDDTIRSSNSEQNVGCAVGIATTVPFPTKTRFSLLLSALSFPFSNPFSYSSILTGLVSVVPASERERVGAVITECSYAFSHDSVFQQYVILMRSLGYREAVLTICERMQVCSVPAAIIECLVLLRDWDCKEAAPAIMGLLEATSDVNVIRTALNTLRSLNIPETVPKVRGMIPDSSPEKAKALEEGLKGWE